MNRNRQKYLEKRNLRIFKVPPLRGSGVLESPAEEHSTSLRAGKFYFPVVRKGRSGSCAKRCHSCSTSVAPVRCECTSNPYLRWRGFSGISVMGARNVVAAPHPIVVSHVKLHWVVQVLRMVQQSDSLVHISGNRARIIHPPGRLADAPNLVDPTLRVQNTPSPIRHSYAFGHSHPQQSKGGLSQRHRTAHR